MSILKWLNKPYIFNLNPKYHLLISFFIGSFIFIFIYAFKPFGMSELENNLFLYSLGFGVVTFLVETFFYVLIPFLYKEPFKDENWTIGKNIIYLLLLVTCISVANWFYNSKVQITDNSNLLTLTTIFSYTFSIAIFPISIYTYFSEKKLNLKKEDKLLPEALKIYGDNNKEYVIINTEDLVYITTQKNYLTFVIETNKGFVEKILRNTLTNVSKELEVYSNFVRCHKSFLINITFFDTISGNSKGFFLESKKGIKKIPVSRSYPIEELKKKIKN